MELYPPFALCKEVAPEEKAPVWTAGLLPARGEGRRSTMITTIKVNKRAYKTL